MAGSRKSVREINERLRRGEAVVMSAMEFKQEVRGGHRFEVAEVDVVTTATRAVMSGTAAMLVVPVADAGVFVRAERLWLNGVPCFTASNPMPRSGMVDALIYGTEESRDHAGRYGGGHLLRDVVEGKEIEVECLTDDGRTIHTTFTIDELRFARLYAFRNDFQNYMAFANIKNQRSYRDHPVSIFACRPMPRLKGLSVSGSGELNPLENDPRGRILRAGMKILVNRAPGVLIGYGTRSAPGARNISVAADMFGMDPEFMGGFKTSAGVEVTNGIAIPIPILDQEVLDGLASCLDENLRLPLADLGDRVPVADLTYADIWAGAALEVEFDPERCICCAYQCPAEYYCPMGAISWKDKRLDQSLCVACGACTANCPGAAFSGKGGAPRGRIGEVRAFATDIPVIFRQSNRHRSELLAEYLKELMVAGRFLLTDSELKLDGESR